MKWKILGIGIAIAMGIGFFQNCSSGFNSKQAEQAGLGSPNPNNPGGLNWNLPTVISMVEDSGNTFDLKTTLPRDGNGNLLVKAGGTFDVDPSGVALPGGMTLSAAGILDVGTASVGDTVGVVFSYTEP